MRSRLALPLACAAVLAGGGCGHSSSAPPSDAATGIADFAPDGPARDSAMRGKRIFITSGTFTGDLISLGNGDGLAGADAACVTAAQSARLGGAWVAWASGGGTDAIDRIHDVGPWFDLAGAKIFANRAGLALGPATGLWLDENGQFLASDPIWTGTDSTGTADLLSGNCLDWTSSSMADEAEVGQVGRSDAAWTANSATTCDQRAHVICFEQ
jgi:hypothetical protein